MDLVIEACADSSYYVVIVQHIFQLVWIESPGFPKSGPVEENSVQDAK